MDASTGRTSPKFLYWAILFLLCLFPFVTLYVSGGGAVEIARAGAPEGQLIYLFSKLFGLCAFVLLFWQLITAMLSKFSRQQSDYATGSTVHIYLGAALLMMAMFHAGFFVSAVSIRSGHLALHLLLPDLTSGYYATALSFGLIALYLVVIAVCSAVLRKRFPTFWKLGHALIYFTIPLILLHAFMVGSEVQSSYFLPVFMVLGVAAILAVISRAVSLVRA
jgi:predicted ferric reductase